MHPFFSLAELSLVLFSFVFEKLKTESDIDRFIHLDFKAIAILYAHQRAPEAVSDPVFSI